ncbi:tyrosine-type recombinase/integrase, partial [Thiohalocapsa sp.]|uniref:tyrosine-type recombinase/integrase n=1 Tax=Thiohalocapsa sp. TaxID=2497641 RepID=UPI0025CC252C
VQRVLSHLASPFDLPAQLLYGCGLRLFECLKLRVQDVNLEIRMLTVHDGKGQKDRIDDLYPYGAERYDEAGAQSVGSLMIRGHQGCDAGASRPVQRWRVGARARWSHSQPKATR